MKYIKAGKKVSVKLTTSRTIHWVVLDKLIADLRIRRPRENEHLCEEIQDLSHLLISKEICAVVRSQNVKTLFNLLPRLEPQSILQTVEPEARSAYAFYALSQVGAFLKKFPFSGEIDTKQEAIDNFFVNERRCKLFNEQNINSLLAMSDRHPDFLGVVEEIQEDIERLIGATPNPGCLFVNTRHGPGTSIGSLYRGGKVTEYYKWSSLPYSTTMDARPYAKVVIESDPRWIGALQNHYRSCKGFEKWNLIDIESFWDFVFVEVDGSRITTVPKTVKTDRTIAIEPLINVFLQLSIDKFFRQMLRKYWGYDLNDQSKNQRMALDASVDNKSATVDLTAASDLISLKICELYLPPLWYDLLTDLRSPKGEVDGLLHPFEKISSMGNGFTFALESLIFGAIVRCAVRRTRSKRETAVYGDDLIVPTSCYQYLHTLLNLAGFKVNVEKTFSSGPFRESCGADYFLGYDVRPIFLKRKLDNIPALLYLHNRFYLKREEAHWTWCLDFKNTLSFLRNVVPENIRAQFFGPPGESLDTFLFSEKPLPKRTEGRVCWAISPVPRLFNKRSDFFFRKLMAKFGPSSYDNRWDSSRRFDTGNAFDITRRGSVQLKCTRVFLP